MKPVQIGCYSAFWGDSPFAIKQFLDPDTPGPDYVVADYLAELTMGLLARSARSKSREAHQERTNTGFISEFLDLALAPHLNVIIQKGVKIVTNAGGLDPVGLKNAIIAHVEKRGLGGKLNIASVSGDNLLSNISDLKDQGQFSGFDPLSGDIREDMFTHESNLLSLNAYLGAEPITVALQQGADIVITGRCVDSALVTGPLAFEFGWNFDTSQQSLDRLASASLAGHIVECGSQATGGNYTDWKQSAFSPNGGWSNMGYPILTYNEDNTFEITKPDKTGGVVDCQGVCEQMLYEVLDPHNYVLPDVVLDLTQVQLQQIGVDRVSARGAKGKPPTPWLKCTAVEQNGHRTLVDFVVCGEEAESKAKWLSEAIIRRTNAIATSQSKDPMAIAPNDFETIIIGAEHSLGVITANKSERKEIVLRVAARHKNRSVLDILAKEVAPFLTNSCPGIFLLTSGRPKVGPNFTASSIMVKRGAVTPLVHLGTRTGHTMVPLSDEHCQPIQAAKSHTVSHGPSGSLDLGLPGTKLIDIAYGRSGDKGDTANIAIIARKPEFYPDILEQVTPELIYSRFRHFIALGGKVTRFEVPGVHAVNFVLTKSLGGGGLSSLRLDRYAIAGATGNLGAKVTEGFLQPSFRDRFSDVILLARSRSPNAEKLVQHGASLRLYAENNLGEALTGVDVLINTVGPTGHHFKEALLRSIVGSDVKLYFPSEFGVDHYVHDFSHDEWDAKKAHFQLASELIPNVRTCRVYAGLFLEDSIGPWFGFDTKRGRYEAVGDPDQKTSYTSMYDVGRALAILASQPVDTIPPEVHLSGDSKSMTEISELMEANGAGSIHVTSVPLESYKAGVLARPSATPERYLRFLMGEGKIQHSIDGIGNQNGIVQVTGGLSIWMSISQFASETKGRPWGEAEWELVD
ncbi:hypothetical protein FSARC_1133 [Fusarium sarcochroum]|uniref:Uncharacterized protein n=1 Tax=Fusarium sarcochroum TaxID=1208366 RepID=A0A8H4U9M1_9HYPO|nr:hypothetical protein FSARC_1133 [Fusarium sarcochroum]